MIDNPLFAGLSDAQRALVERLSSLRHYAGDEVIIHEGDDEPILHLLAEGQVRVVKAASQAGPRAADAKARRASSTRPYAAKAVAVMSGAIVSA